MSLRKLVCAGLLVLSACGGDEGQDLEQPDGDVTETADSGVVSPDSADGGDAGVVSVTSSRTPDAAMPGAADAASSLLADAASDAPTADAAAPCVQTLFYIDADGDGYGSSAGALTACTAPAGYVANPGDCYDVSSAVHPGVVVFHNAQRGDGSFDYDCDGTDEQQVTALASCAPGPNRGGWMEKTVPDCGVAGLMHGVDPNVGMGDTCANNIVRIQACR